MKHVSLFVASALVLATPMVVSAQQSQQGQQARSPQLSADAHHIIDKKAVNAQGKDIGTVKDALIGQDGRVQALVMDVGGKNRAVPWDQVSMKADQLTINMSDQQLSQLPEYQGEGD